MDPDANDAPCGNPQYRETPSLSETQPAAFLAALAEHRAQIGTTHPLAILIIRLDRFQFACETVGGRRAALLRAEVKSRVAGAGVMPVVMHWLSPADLGIACLLPEGNGDLADVSQGIAAALRRPYTVDGFELFLTCSIGTAIDSPDSATERNLQLAFDAMLQISRRGGGGIGNASQAVSPRLATLLAALPEAVSRGEFSLQLQPRASFDTTDIAAYTVRLRWHHPVVGRIAPQDFLPAAEALGMMREIGQWLVQQLLQLIRKTEHLATVQFTLLASSPQLLSDDAVAMLQHAVEASGISPGRLCVEVPAEAIAHVPAAAEKAARLHASGIQIALSDFTDDQASRQALATVSPDMVMLDARHLGSSAQARDAAAALRAACMFAKLRGVAVYARGVETRAQLEAVRGWGCDGVQGYLLAQPFPAQWLVQTHAAVAERARQLLRSDDSV